MFFFTYMLNRWQKGARVAQWVRWLDYLTTHTSLSPIRRVDYTKGALDSYKSITNTAWVRARLYKLQKECTRLAAASDKIYQLLDHGRWFSPGTQASSTTKTGRHDIILLKVVFKHQNQIKLYCKFRNLCMHLLLQITDERPECEF